MTPEELRKEFSKVLSKLPDGKRKELYNKLKALPESEREKAMLAIVNKSKANQKPVNVSYPSKEPVKKVNSKPAGKRPTQEPVRKQNKKTNKKTNKPANTKTKQPEPIKVNKKSEKKSVKRRVYIICEVLVLLMAIAVAIFGLQKFGVFGSKETEVTETSSAPTIMPMETETVPTATPTPTPTPTEVPTPTPIPDGNPDVDLTGLTVVLDAGHQLNTDDERETCASWLGNEKARCTAGTIGVNTGIRESELTLDYTLLIGEYLEQKGATVVYTRTENDVDISNQERALVAVENEADLFIRIHADAANDSVSNGVKVYVPENGSYTSYSSSWANNLGTLVADAEGFEFVGVKATNQYTGLNYANTVRSFQLNIGYLSNIDNEATLTQEENKLNVAYAIAEFCNSFT